MYFLTAIVALTSFLAPPVGAWLMSKSIWLPFELAISLDLVCYPLMLAMPETWKPILPSEISHPVREEQPMPDQRISPDPSMQHPSTSAEQDQTREPDALMHSVKIWIQRARVFLSEIFKVFLIPNLLFCFTIFFLRAIAVSNTTLLFQYASKRLSWKLGQTAWLLVVRSAGAFLTTGIVLPALNAYILKNQRLTAQRLDFGTVKASLLVLALGYLFIAGATNPVILVAGTSRNAPRRERH
jgi:hypothetical protein